MNRDHTAGADPRVAELAERLVERLRAGRQFLTAGGFTDERGVVFLLRISPRTARNWRARGEGPPAYRSGRILYDLLEISAWLCRSPAKPGNVGESRDIEIDRPRRYGRSRS